MTKRDEFSAETKRTMAVRAAHFCSNPRCMKLTAGPHSNEEEALTTGHAAHIHAAAENGPRWDPKQTTEQRKHISNGIWLCRECGDIVDKNTEAHSADQLRRWKSDHEKMISEVRTQGYSSSLSLLQSRAAEPKVAKRLIALLEDRRALWAAFDAEFPDRVRRSLDGLRSQVSELRGGEHDGTPMDALLLSITKTIHIFFNTVEGSDLTTLKCDANDPEWVVFRDALAALRKSIGLQIANIAHVHRIALSADLKGIVPEPLDGRA